MRIPDFADELRRAQDRHRVTVHCPGDRHKCGGQPHDIGRDGTFAYPVHKTMLSEP
ncbi:hypothetical protein V3M81_00465 [Trueperella pyogenes]|uniref:hypothetical protein n=1 Tax=Trueperella pyogenes TaxID=1661 RepID=UPI00345DD5FD